MLLFICFILSVEEVITYRDSESSDITTAAFLRVLGRQKGQLTIFFFGVSTKTKRPPASHDRGTPSRLS